MTPIEKLEAAISKLSHMQRYTSPAPWEENFENTYNQITCPGGLVGDRRKSSCAVMVR